MDYCATFRSEDENLSGQHPASLVCELFESTNHESNLLHCQQLENWYHEYAHTVRKMPYLFKKSGIVSQLHFKHLLTKTMSSSQGIFRPGLLLSEGMKDFLHIASIAEAMDPSMQGETIKVPITCLKCLCLFCAPTFSIIVSNCRHWDIGSICIFYIFVYL